MNKDKLHIRHLDLTAFPLYKEFDCVTFKYPLKRGHHLTSKNRVYSLRLRDEGMLQLFRKIFINDVFKVWDTNTGGQDVVELKFQNDGLLTLVGPHGKVVWHNDCKLGEDKIDVNKLKCHLTDFGNIVCYYDGQAYWSSNTTNKIKKGTSSTNKLDHHTAMLEGEILQSKNLARRLVLQKDGNLVILNSQNRPLWASNTAGHGTGPYHLKLQEDNNLVIFSTNKTGHGPIHIPIWQAHVIRPGVKGKCKLTNEGFLEILDENQNILWKAGHPLEPWEFREYNYNDRIDNHWPLHQGQFLRSYDGQFVLGFLHDGNLVVLNKQYEVTWASNTAGQGKNMQLRITPQGSLCIFNEHNHPIWSTHTDHHQGHEGHMYKLLIQDDGNLVLYNHHSHPVWAIR